MEKVQQGQEKKKTLRKLTTYVHILTLSLQPFPNKKYLLCQPPTGSLCSWRSFLINSITTESYALVSKTLGHASHSAHCKHLSASTNPVKIETVKESRRFESVHFKTRKFYITFFNKIITFICHNDLTSFILHKQKKTSYLLQKLTSNTLILRAWWSWRLNLILQTDKNNHLN